jgi:molecular chaperone GrpE (heat shock protein)
LNKKHADLSLQIEEIYDLTREADPRELREALNVERVRESQLLQTVVGLSDLLEHFCIYARQSGSVELERQASLLWQNSQSLLDSSGFSRWGAGGECLDPALHSVQGAVASELERERVIEVLQSGYSYMGMVLRKAAVIVSKGIDDNIQEEENENEQNSWH